jgi:hypothetical protein
MQIFYTLNNNTQTTISPWRGAGGEVKQNKDTINLRTVLFLKCIENKKIATTLCKYFTPQVLLLKLPSPLGEGLGVRSNKMQIP